MSGDCGGGRSSKAILVQLYWCFTEKKTCCVIMLRIRLLSEGVFPSSNAVLSAGKLYILKIDKDFPVWRGVRK